MTFHVPEECRDLRRSKPEFGCNGVFFINHPSGSTLSVIASDGNEWEHVSVSVGRGGRCPTWSEMCFVKSLFWDAEDCCVQFHPPRSQYVNVHPNVLHIWRHKDWIESPPAWLSDISEKRSTGV